MKRRADLSPSTKKKLLAYEAIIEAKTNNMTPESCLKLLKFFSEERNAALHDPHIKDAKYQLRESFYLRNVNADLRWLMRAIKRRLGGELPPNYAGCKAYYKRQRIFFKNLLRVKGNRATGESLEPGKLSYNLEPRRRFLSYKRHKKTYTLYN